MILREAWDKRNKLYDEVNKLYDEGDKLFAEADKLYDEGGKLYAEAGKLRAEGDSIYVQAVTDFFGPEAIINWSTGEVSGKPLAIPAGEFDDS